MTLDLNQRRRLSVVLWLAGLTFVLVWVHQRTGSGHGRAVAFAPPVQVASTEGGRLLSLDVELHQAVQNGEVVARLDSAPLVEAQKVLAAELLSFQEAELAEAKGSARLFARDEEAAGLEVARLTTAVMEGQAQDEGLRERLVVDERLAAVGLLPEQSAADTRRELAVVTARLEADREALELALRAAGGAGARRAGEPIENRWQVVAAQRRVDEVAAQVERTVVRSEIAGQISWIHSREGEVVLPGQPILEVTRTSTREVHAYLDATGDEDLRVGAPARVRRLSGEVLAGQVASVGGDRRQLPEQLWHIPAAPEWGYLVRILVSDGELSPGEPLEVRLGG